MEPSRLRRALAGAPVDTLRERHGARYKWLLLSTVMVGAIASILTSTIVNVALPPIATAFHIGKEQVQWVSSAYMAATTVAMLVLPWSLERIGFRFTFFVAMALLFAGSLGGGLATGYPFLIGTRIVQGAAAGLLQPLATVLILRAFPLEQQGMAMGVFGFGVVLAPAVAPSIGGVLTDAFGWRAVFFLSVPFSLLGVGLGLRLLPTMGMKPSGRPFDWAGLALVTLFVVALLVGLVEIHDAGIGSARTWAWLGGALAALALAAWLQVRGARRLINPEVFASAAFRIGLLVALIYGMGLFGSTLLVPIFVQESLHYSPTESGALLLPAGLVLAVTIFVAGRLADVHHPRLLVMIGLICFAASFGLMALAPRSGFWPLAMMLVIGRFGLGMILPGLSVGTVRGLALGLVGDASGLFNFTRMLGGAVGASGIAIVVEARTGTLRAALPAAEAALRAYREGFVVLAVLFVIASVAASRLH